MMALSIGLFCGREQAHRESWSLNGEEKGLSSKACQIHRMMLRGTQVTTEPGDLQKGWNQGCTSSELGRKLGWNGRLKIMVP